MATTAQVTIATPDLELIAPRVSVLRRLGRIARDNPLGVFGLIVVLTLAFCAVFAPQLAPHDPNAVGVGGKNLNPSTEFPFGTDTLGRDLLSRVIFGARISLMVGFASVFFGTVIGTMLGIISGYTGGTVDNLIQRTVDTAIAFPPLLALLILRAVLGAELHTLIIAVGIAIIFPVTRIIRGAVLSERNNQYVEAARALGATTPRILLFHIAPNVAALAIIIGTSFIGAAILAEAALAFLGLSLPTAVTWGFDVSKARQEYPIHIWWAFFPGAAITLTVLGFNLLGDSMRDILDPRLRGRL